MWTYEAYNRKLVGELIQFPVKGVPVIPRIEVTDEGEKVVYSVESTEPNGLTTEQAVEWLGQWLDGAYKLTVHHSAAGFLPPRPPVVGGTVMPEPTP